MTIAMLIGLWIYDECSYNKYHSNYPHIARVMQQQTLNGEVNTGSNVPAPLFKELQNSFEANFSRVVITSWLQRHVLAYNGSSFTKPGNFMSAGAAEMLSLKMIKGSASGLKDPATILLSESTAKAIFAAACLGTLAITLFTVSYQAIRTALLNPVKSLQGE
jgi:putative ABC transport system permease protein